jgi:hypothetical protein
MRLALLLSLLALPVHADDACCARQERRLQHEIDRLRAENVALREMCRERRRR